MWRFTEIGNTRLNPRIGRREILLSGLISGGGFVSGRLLGQARFFLGASATSAEVHTVPGAVNELLTPNIDFFIRNHFATPRINVEMWNLEISGLVDAPLKLSYSDFLLASSARHAYTIECAGNRSGGAGVGTARWS